MKDEYKKTFKALVVCPNKNHPDWKKLVADLGGGERGETKAYIAFFRNGHDIPDIKTALPLLYGKKLAPCVPELKPKPSDFERLLFELDHQQQKPVSPLKR